MAYIKERGNNNYFVRVSCGILDNGRPFQKSRLFRPSRVNLPESKVRKELDAFVKALEEECRIEFETKRQPQTNMFTRASHTLFVLDTPSAWEVIKRQAVNLLHWNFTTAGYSAGCAFRLQKYHCPLRMSLPPFECYSNSFI